LRVDADDCFTIAWQPDAGDPVSRAANWLGSTQPTSAPLSVASCALRPGRRDPAQAEKERYFSELFERMEKRCPRVFHGRTALTEPLGRGWSRYYAALDARIEATEEQVVLNRYVAAQFVHLGKPSDWDGKGPIPAVCGGP